MNVVAFDGTVVILSDERWQHVVLRHPELKNRRDLVLDAVRRPDEAYVDLSGGVHVLKRLKSEVSDFLIVIFTRDGERGYIRTAYYTGSRRKSRRCRAFRRLRLS